MLVQFQGLFLVPVRESRGEEKLNLYTWDACCWLVTGFLDTYWCWGIRHLGKRNIVFYSLDFKGKKIKSQDYFFKIPYSHSHLFWHFSWNLFFLPASPYFPIACRVNLKYSKMIHKLIYMKLSNRLCCHHGMVFLLRSSIQKLTV